MSTKQISLTLIVAATKNNGIGKGGTLPWPMLKKEMGYFSRTTKRVPLPTATGSLQSDKLKGDMLKSSQRNAVIMGRKTWESIPTKFRPLKDRTNVVITSQSRESLGSMPDDVVVVSSLQKGLEALESFIKDGKALPLGRAFVIGGSSVYEAALGLEQTRYVLLTRIQNDYECDTFFPAALDSETSAASEWRRGRLQDLRDFVQEEVPDGVVSEDTSQGEVQFEYQLYERA